MPQLMPASKAGTRFTYPGRMEVLSRRRKTGRLLASMTEVVRLFQIAGTAELKARPPYAVLVRGAWSRGRVDERNVIVIDEPEC